ncbi:MAG: 4-hydroxy-4-methyl-2-oxoglutarate aldolase/4-carboxy-4-hydroxy-2-oxoadipate aldolase [Alphaproteobacteria bacterium MarineAlpha5_Bin6]|nr:MAG: 4-hydroxy-4-methyl-2-oxoglutarate aldolase/4-carboxy-4-hydroxy-2-oxoadipate aldolase [Alphaproteobacteria bacterium MarineAlpha5_Bin6]|tara:strand:+ start:3305 stop:3952 length:648 start_codon:yes stop_codon:yes gene_type:complete
MNDFVDRLGKCYTGVVHDIMRDLGYENFVLPPNIRPSKDSYVIAGQIFTLEGMVDKSLDHHASLLAWTGFLSKAPSDKVIICQPHTDEVALMGELSAETLQLKGARGYIVDGGARDLDFILKIDFPLWSKFYTPRDVVAFWKPTSYEKKISIGDVEIHNNDYVLADIDGVVIIPQKNIEEILNKSEKLMNTENLVRKAIREGMDPQEAYIKFGAF